MVGFIENSLDFMNEITTIPFAFSSDALDVFGVNAEADLSWFHRFLPLVLQRLEKC